jgi:hypothetical protein
MDFVSADSSIVRSIRQKAMLNEWLRLDEIVYYLVERPGDEIHFKIESDGRRAFQAYGETGRGRYLHEYLPFRFRDMVLPVYTECIRRNLPVFTVAKLKDINGTEVEFERLLLPFSSTSGIERMIAYINTISIDGNFEIKNLMRDNDGNELLTYDVLGVIDQKLFHHKPAKNALADL